MPLRVALSPTGMGQLTTQLTIDLVNPFARHRLDQEISQCPNQRVHPVGGVARRARVKITMGVSSKGAHLILKLRESAEMVHPALLIERGHRLGAGYLPARGAHRSERGVGLDHPQKSPRPSRR